MKRLPLENDHLQAARYCYRSELPVASPFCVRCPGEGAAAGMLFPLSVECREAINAWYAGKSIPLKVAAVQHAMTEAGGCNFELCMVVCFRSSKQGIQFKGRSHRFCMGGCCWNHALVWACPSPLPGGGGRDWWVRKLLAQVLGFFRIKGVGPVGAGRDLRHVESCPGSMGQRVGAAGK